MVSLLTINGLQISSLCNIKIVRITKIINDAEKKCDKIVLVIYNFLIKSGLMNNVKIST